MENSKPVDTLVETNMKSSKKRQGAKVDPTYFQSLVGNLCYLTTIRPDILYDVGLISRYIESPIQIHLQNERGY